MDCLIKTGCCLRLSCATDCLLKVRVGFTVVELHGFYTAEVVVVPSKLRAAGGLRKSCFRYKFVRLVVEIVMYIISEKPVN